jgi:hypothetical protein
MDNVFLIVFCPAFYDTALLSPCEFGWETRRFELNGAGGWPGVVVERRWDGWLQNKRSKTRREAKRKESKRKIRWDVFKEGIV